MDEKTITAQLDTWRGRFGDAYAERNSATAQRVRDYTRAYAKMWECMAADPPASILECGCNVGIALRALSNITSAELHAIEPNAKARAKAIAAGVTAKGNIVEGWLQSIPFPDRHFDMAFTSGVLIHVEPDSLDTALSELGRVANKYVLMTEYYSKHLQEIEYRGQNEMLWKADYGELFMEKNPGWRPIEAGFFWDKLTGFGDSNWWVFKREEQLGCIQMAPATGTENQGTRSLEQLFTEAIAQHEAGRLDIARPIYEKLRSAVGPNPDILHLLGTLYFQQGSPDRGARLIRQAIILRPDPASYYDHFGSAARGTSNLALAETAYGRACIINPASGSAFLNSAIVALETGQAEKAVEKAGQAVHLMPDNTEAWLRLGIALYTIKEYASAAEALDQARDKAPESVEAYFHLQKVHTALRNTQTADKITKQSIALDPGRHELYAHFRSGDLSGITNWSSNFPKRLATIIKPASSNTWEQLAAEYYSEMKYADAAKAAQHAALIAPGLSSPYNSLATTTYHLGEFKRSIRISHHGLFVSPDFGDIGFNLSLSAFSSGDIDTGWRYWPHRLKMSKAPKRFSLPDRWNPDDGAPGHLLIASEQGLGDDILHLSCLPDLLQHVLLVTIETDPRLFPLLKRSFPHLNLIEKQLRSGANGEAIHDYENVQGKHQFTHSLTSGDLPALYRHGPHKVPAGNGYLRVDATMQLEWQTRLSEFGPPPYLGLCWRSGTFITSHRAIRYHTIEELVSEIPTDTFTLVNLQYGDARDEIAGLAAERRITIHDFPDLNQTNELDRVAALMSCLDLVIAPATAALALACAVGVPVIGLEKSYFLYGDENDPMFANLYPVKRPSEPTIVPDRAQRMGEAICYFLEHGKLPIREP